MTYCVICQSESFPLLDGTTFFRGCRCQDIRFHGFCLTQYLLFSLLSTSSGEATCPMCRQPCVWDRRSLFQLLGYCARVSRLIVPFNMLLGLSTLLLAKLWPCARTDTFLLSAVVGALTTCCELQRQQKWSRPSVLSPIPIGTMLLHLVTLTLSWGSLGLGVYLRIFLEPC